MLIKTKTRKCKLIRTSHKFLTKLCNIAIQINFINLILRDGLGRCPKKKDIFCTKDLIKFRQKCVLAVSFNRDWFVCCKFKIAQISLCQEKRKGWRRTKKWKKRKSSWQSLRQTQKANDSGDQTAKIRPPVSNKLKALHPRVCVCWWYSWHTVRRAGKHVGSEGRPSLRVLIEDVAREEHRVPVCAHPPLLQLARRGFSVNCPQQSQCRKIQVHDGIVSFHESTYILSASKSSTKRFSRCRYGAQQYVCTCVRDELLRQLWVLHAWTDLQ